MAVLLWRIRNIRISPATINNIERSIVTSYYPLGVSKPEPQTTSHSMCRYFSRLHGLKFGTTAPALSGWEMQNCFFKSNVQVSDELLNINIVRYYSTANKGTPEVPEKPPSLLQRFKQMYRDYWYVLVPVHLVTSAVWFSSFYYLAKSGVDIASLLETIGAGEKLVDKLRNSNSTMGYLAIAYALYKIATPLRYTVTLGGTTISIKYLKDWGYIKPLPPKEKLKSMLTDGKEVILQQKDHLTDLYQKEKDTLLNDKKNFYRYFWPKIVRKPPDKKKDPPPKK